MRVPSVLMLLAGVGLPYACGGTAIVDPSDDDGGGGSGATTSSSTSSSSSMGGAPSTNSVGPAPGPGPSTSSGTTMCVGCGDYIGGPGDIEELCGFVAVDPSGMFVDCQPNTSCELLAELQACTCSDCATDCVMACNGEDISQECLGCITDDCNSEFNACAGDVQ